MKERKNKEELNEIEEKDLPKAEGLIIKATGGFYYVRCGETTFECRARGIFRKHDKSPLVGDKVTISVLPNEKGYIHAIHERKNSLVRPPLANLDQLVMVVSVAEPAPNILILDKLILPYFDSVNEPKDLVYFKDHEVVSVISYLYNDPEGFYKNTFTHYAFKDPVRTKRDLVIPAYKCEAGGQVEVAVVLNQGGEVISARVISGGDERMREEALKAARASLFNIDNTAPARHSGTITYTFIPQ